MIQRPDIAATVLVCIGLVIVMVAFRPLETALGLALWRVLILFLLVLNLQQWRRVHAELRQHRAEIEERIALDGRRRQETLDDLESRIDAIVAAATTANERRHGDLVERLDTIANVTNGKHG